MRFLRARVGTLSGDSSFIGLKYEGADPFPEEKFFDPWWSVDGGKTWPQINDYRNVAGNETATANNAEARIDKMSKPIVGTTEVPPIDLKNLATRLVAYAADMRSKYAEHAGETLKQSTQYKGLAAAGSAIVGYFTVVGGVLFKTFLDWGISLGEGVLKGLNALGFKVGPAKDIEHAEESMNALATCLTDSLKIMVPPAWQTPGLPVIIGGDNASDRYMSDIMCWNLGKWKAMPRSDREVVSQWWALYLAQADDPEIATAFASLWNSSAFADDTQVLLVAMPIAKAAGIPWQSFAKKLWARSAGWRARPDLLLGMDGERLVPLAPEHVPVNASNVQWQVLASDAFKLAEEITGGPVGKPSDTRLPSGSVKRPGPSPTTTKRGGSIPGGRGGSIPGRAPPKGAPRYGTPMASWSGGPSAPVSDKAKGGIGAIAIIGGIILGGIMLLRGGHA